MLNIAKILLVLCLLPGFVLSNTLVSTSYHSGKCPSTKHATCLSTTVSGVYNWKTKRGKITISGQFPVFEASYITMIGYDEDGIELGTLYYAVGSFNCADGTDNTTGCDADVFVGSGSFTEYTNKLPDDLQSAVRSIEIRSDGDTKRITCKPGYALSEDGLCTNDDEYEQSIYNGSNAKFKPYGSPYYGPLPNNCWGDPKSDYWCN